MSDPSQKENLNIREERFCLAFVNTANKYKAFDIAEYTASTQGAKAAAVSRLLKRPKIRQRIDEYNKEYMLAQGVTDERIIGNLAEIAFDKDNQKPDRNRALETLCRTRSMLTDNINQKGIDQPQPLTEQELRELKRMAILSTNTKKVMG